MKHILERAGKAAVRAALQLPSMILLIAASPLLILFGLFWGLAKTRRVLVLWAIYDGDEKARDRDDWKHGEHL